MIIIIIIITSIYFYLISLSAYVIWYDFEPEDCLIESLYFGNCNIIYGISFGSVTIQVEMES